MLGMRNIKSRLMVDSGKERKAQWRSYSEDSNTSALI